MVSIVYYTVSNLHRMFIIGCLSHGVYQMVLCTIIRPRYLELIFNNGTVVPDDIKNNTTFVRYWPKI
jgi:hypothetical protein